MADSVAIKRLSAVEVDPAASHQREFHADRLRHELGIDGDRVAGPLIAVYHPKSGEPVVDETTYTCYQSRRPPRSEYRLYPATALFRERARQGDLMLVFRNPEDEGLRIVIAERGGRVEAEVLDAFFARNLPDLERFQYVQQAGTRDGVAEVGEALTLLPPDVDGAVFAHPTYLSAIESHEYPMTGEMAESARQIVRETLGDRLDPDAFLTEGLAAETKMFFAIERELAGAELAVLVATNPDVGAVLEWSTRRLNSRKSRRGHSLQRHFEALLTREGIPFTPECRTEAPPPADIMVPSCASYGDPAFPSDRLRIVSCKSTLKERWMEIVPEARRIETKYVLTLDDRLTDSVIKAMHVAHVRAFVPADVIAVAYSARPTRLLLSTVTELVADLRATLH